MGLTLVLEAHNIIIHNLCRYIKSNNLNMYKFMPSFLWYVSMLYTFSCTLVAHTTVRLKIIQYQIYSSKWQLVAYSDWLQTTRLLVVLQPQNLLIIIKNLHNTIICKTHSPKTCMWKSWPSILSSHGCLCH
jgi:hypothetical protein